MLEQKGSSQWSSISAMLNRMLVISKKYENLFPEKRMRQLTGKGREYQIDLQLDKRSKSMARLQWNAKAIDDLLYSSSNHIAVKEELQQYSDIFKFLWTQHEEWCELLGVEDQENKVGWFDNLCLNVFNFKHKIYSLLIHHHWEIHSEEIAEPRYHLGDQIQWYIQGFIKTEAVRRESKSCWIGSRSSNYVRKSEGRKSSKDALDPRGGFKSQSNG